MAQQLPALDIASLSAAYAAGACRPTEIVARIGEAIAAAGHGPIWIDVVETAQLLAQAEAVERRRAAGEELPLYGLPFALKDAIDVAGRQTTAACPAFAYRAATSAPVVQRLSAAGAILLGKTNLDQFCTGLVGVRSPYGACRSLFDPAYIAGGSSSGSALAVAAGLASFAVGTDTAGSGRVPAAFNNIVGLKPSKGLISSRGVVPACPSQDCVSILAGTVGDAMAVLRVAAGYDPADPFSRRAPDPAFQASALPREPRFGIPSRLEFFGDWQAESLYQASLDKLRAVGSLAEIDIEPFLAAGALLYEGPWLAERLASHQAFLDAHPEAFHPVVAALLERGRKITAVDAFRGMHRLAELRRATAAQWERMDLLVLPTSPTIYSIDQIEADPIGLNTRLGYYTQFVNLLDLSAIAVPAGFRRDGLPFGISLIAPAFGEGALAPIADRFHRAQPSTIGATGRPLPSVGSLAPGERESRPGWIRVGVVGAHLSGQPLNWQLTQRGARLVETTRTAAGYRLFALPTRPSKPGLIRDRRGAGAIEMEVWELEAAPFAALVAEIPSPLTIGSVRLEDGRMVQGFLCESEGVEGAREITSFGGWRAWLAHRG
ncbi:MAG TPA: allophanate hydrolase [Candidatus Binataceae bacterium]|nr:allophanate hydrolase [Candidatus Binataceae bacterium]